MIPRFSIFSIIFNAIKSQKFSEDDIENLMTCIDESHILSTLHNSDYGDKMVNIYTFYFTGLLQAYEFHF